ncbi:hypothetical protein DFQ29_000203, partial [Apophysomyces sp. BC1021]
MKGENSEKRSRESKRKDRRRNGAQGRDSSKQFLQAPVILERRDRTESSDGSSMIATEAPAIKHDEQKKISHSTSSSLRPLTAQTSQPIVTSEKLTEELRSYVVPFFRKKSRFNTEIILK